MKIKITQEGWENFTGVFGSTEFVDGISVFDVSQNERMCLAAVVSVTDLDGNGVSAAQMIIDANGKSAESVSMPTEDMVEEPVAVTYTKAQLEEIADKDGIKGLRAIADPLNLRDNSIVELIGKILRVAGAKPEAPVEQAEATPE